MTAIHAPDLPMARELADTVLYEGYVLFPYRASAPKNRYRWQWGVVAPSAHVAAGSEEGGRIVSETVLRADRGAQVEVLVRFLTERRRQVRTPDGTEVEELDLGEELLTTWDEGIEHEVTTGPIALDALAERPWSVAIDIPAAASSEEHRDDDGEVVASVRRTAHRVSGRLTVGAAPGPGGTHRVTATVENLTDWAQPDAPREQMLARALLGTHLLLVAERATFASVIDPPPWARAAVADAASQGTWPVLVGDDDRIVLSAPIILGDHPEIAPESPGPSFDATEVDELLTLAVHGLTDAEKRAARATDPRAAEIIDRAEVLPPRLVEHLHGTIRSFRSASEADDPAPTAPGDAATRVPEAGALDVPWADDAIDVGHRRATVADPRGDPRFATVAPEAGGPVVDEELVETLGLTDEPIRSVPIDGRDVRVGDRVRLSPGRRADAQDMFVAGRTATVERIVRDVDGETHLAVGLDDDPAADVHGWYGRFLYFRADEVHPVDREEPA